MDLAVDHAGEDVEAGAVDDLAGARWIDAADFGDAAGRDRDVALAYAVVVDEGAAAEKKIEG
jgi:hypothetical protein